MHKLYYQPDGVWVGDIMPYAEDGEFFIYHQRDTRNPEPFGEPFGWALAKTRDFVNYEDLGESLVRGSDDEADQFIYAGSVFRAEGMFHAFYTGYNREYLKAGKTSQVLLHAVSSDGILWKKSEEALKLPPQEGYDRRNWRDPFILWDEETSEYMLILGARKGEDKRKQTGRLVKFTSKNLEDWKFKGDFWSPETYTMFEMPELFRIGAWWYLIYSEYSDKNKIRYRMSNSLDGPWLSPGDDAFDGRAYYAGRTAYDGRRRVMFGWVPTKEKEDDKNSYLWGGTFVPHEICQKEDGTLGTKPPESLWNTFEDWKEFLKFDMKTIDTKKEKIITCDTGILTAFETTVTFDKGTGAFSLKFYEDQVSGVSYEYKFDISENRVTFDKCPNYPWYQCFNIGLERPLVLKARTEYHIQLIIDDTIAVLYVNGTALSTRVYEKPGMALSMTVTDGRLDCKNTKISTKIRNER